MPEANLKPASPLPTLGAGESLYKQVKALLAARIARGDWKPGEALPSEPQLAEKLGVSISTVRNAVTELVRAQALVRRQGRGTFISPRTEAGSVYRFFRVYSNESALARQMPTSEIVGFRSGVAGEADAVRLGLGPTRAERLVFKLRNVLRMGSDVVQVSDIVLPQRRFPEATLRKLQSAAPTLYGAYQSTYGITVVRTEDQITAVLAPDDVAQLLQQKRGTAVLKVHRLARSVDGVPVESRWTYIRTDAYHLLHVIGETA